MSAHDEAEALIRQADENAMRGEGDDCVREQREALTNRQLDVIGYIDYCTEEYGSLVTSRTTRRRDVMRLVKLGYVKSRGLVDLIDEYGYRTDRQREGFVLTDAGEAVIKDLEEEAFCEVAP